MHGIKEPTWHVSSEELTGKRTLAARAQAWQPEFNVPYQILGVVHGVQYRYSYSYGDKAATLNP